MSEGILDSGSVTNPLELFSTIRYNADVEEILMAALPPLPSAASNENFDWIVQNFDALAQQHPNCWIAVDHCRVLAADPGLDVVKKTAVSMGTPGDIVYSFVDDGFLIFGIA